MKKLTTILGWIIFAIVVMFFISTLWDRKPTQQSTDNVLASGTTRNDPKLQSLMKDEPKVKDYALTEANVLYVAVFDDGTSRDGLAEYFCSLMKENNINAHRVKIVKVGTINHRDRDNAYGILLGESWCK